jgi:hypothetical protein
MTKEDQVHVFTKSVSEAHKIRKALVLEVSLDPDRFFLNPEEKIKCHTRANTQVERELVENDWRTGNLKVVISTDTLLVVCPFDHFENLS